MTYTPRQYTSRPVHFDHSHISAWKRVSPRDIRSSMRPDALISWRLSMSMKQTLSGQVKMLIRQKACMVTNHVLVPSSLCPSPAYHVMNCEKARVVSPKMK
eukprot:scaffold73751_cov33-Tisochrysis_lutea.AAC.2